jgi:hypothetical protein
MRKHFVCLALLLVVAFAPAVFAQNPERAGTTSSQSSERDISGVWMAAPPPQQPKQLGGMVPKEVGMTPWAKARFDAAGGGNNDTNPQLRCEPLGATRWTQFVRPFEIVQTPGRIFFFPEIDHAYTVVYMDGRPLPKAEELPFGPTYMGYSVGHWDGNDLVIETVGVTDKAWLDNAGHPHTDDMRLTWRYHRADHNTLDVSITFDDSKAYTKSWTYGPRRYLLKTGRDWEIQEQECLISDQKYFEENIGNHLKKSQDDNQQ